MAQELALEVKLSYANVLVTSESKLLYALLEMKPAAGALGKQAPLNLAVVLDKSGSMYEGEKLEYVKEAVQYVISQLRPEDICSVVAFAEKGRVVIPAGQITDKDLAKRVIQNINQIEVGSGTEMSAGIDAATVEVKKNFARDRVNHVILLTDGLTQHEERCREKCRQAADEGLSFSTIGVGNDFNEKLLIDMANTAGGKSYYIERPKDIPDIFAQELKGVQSVIAQNLRLKVTLTRDIGIRRAFKVKPLINDLGPLPVADRTVEIKIGDLQQNELQSVLLELVLPSRQPGNYRVAQAKILYDLPTRNLLELTESRDVIVGYTVDPAVSSVVNPEVMQVVDMVSVFRQQTRALDLAQLGQSAKATQLLRSAATTLLEHGQKDLAQQALDEAQRIEQGGAASSGGTKKLQYGTRKLTQLLGPIPPA